MHVEACIFRAKAGIMARNRKILGVGQGTGNGGKA